MRRISMLAGCLVLLQLVGCRDAGDISTNNNVQGGVQTKGILVTIDEDGRFPESLAGRWTGPQEWEFNFEPNGVISTIRHMLGGVEMKPWFVASVPVVGGSEAVFKPGSWFVNYTPSTRILTVQITVEDFNFPVGGGTLTGNCVDIFTGPVSEDGTIWNVTWTNFPDYTAHTKELPNYKLPVVDPNGEIREVVFEKAKGLRTVEE